MSTEEQSAKLGWMGSTPQLLYPKRALWFFFHIGDLGFYKGLLSHFYHWNDWHIFLWQQRLSTTVYSSQTKRREWRIKFHKRLIHSSLWRLRIQVTGFFQFFFLTSRKLLFLPFVVINDGLGNWKKDQIFLVICGESLGAKFSWKRKIINMLHELKI